MGIDKNDYILNDNKKESKTDDMNDISYFHKLVKYSREVSFQANKIFFEAIDLVVDAIDAQEEALELQDKGKDVQDKYFKWLEEYGCKYDCNFDSEKCYKLLDKIDNLEIKIEDLEESGLDLVIEGVNKWKLARKLTSKLINMEEKYTECIHNIDGIRESNNSEDYFEDSDSEGENTEEEYNYEYTSEEEYESNPSYEESDDDYLEESSNYEGDDSSEIESDDSSEIENKYSENSNEEPSQKFYEDQYIWEYESDHFYEYNESDEKNTHDDNGVKDSERDCNKENDDEDWYYTCKINNGMSPETRVNILNGNGAIKKNHRISGNWNR